jgi:type IV pilus assembly protein PilE
MNKASKRIAAAKRQRGVTLIELMTVVAIIAIIATIAIPTYRRYLIRAQRSEAKIALLQLQTAQEKFYLQNNSYANNANLTTASPTGLGLQSTTETGKYTLAITAYGAGGQTYTATATPKSGGGQTDDTGCTSYTITDRGTKGSTGTATSQTCWR